MGDLLTAYATSVVRPRIVPAPVTRDWMDRTDGRFAYRCLPVLIANQSGWLILNNFSITATWSGGSARDAVRVEYGRGPTPPLVASHFGEGVLTWTIPYLFRTPPGWNLLVRGPANHPKDGVSPLEGVVETDWSNASFTMNWKLTRPGLPVRFEVDEPICMICPHRRGDLEGFQPEIRSIDSDPAVAEAHRQWSGTRRDFLRDLRDDALPDGNPGWQRHYFQGRHTDGELGVHDHQTRLRLLPFEVSCDA